MNYRLIVLTHGDGACLRATLEAFVEHVTPAPSSVVYHRDGPTGEALVIPNVSPGAPTSYSKAVPGEGFCRASARCWEAAADAAEPWIFWLEHDFRFVRDVDLRDVVGVLDDQPQVAQMAFYRNAVNGEEQRHGGYLQIPGRSYQRRVTHALARDRGGERPVDAEWFEHTGYWTTNPNLFRREIAQGFQWPTEPRCEGHFGFQLKAGRYGTTFGVWGGGEVYVEHEEPRSGFGY